MDFDMGLPQIPRGVGSTWIIYGRLTKAAQFIQVHTF